MYAHGWFAARYAKDAPPEPSRRTKVRVSHWRSPLDVGPRTRDPPHEDNASSIGASRLDRAGTPVPAVC
jgi:hypothetical protein